MVELDYLLYKVIYLVLLTGSIIKKEKVFL